MNIDEKIAYIKDILTYLGEPFRLVNRNPDYLPEITDGDIIIDFRFDDFRKKLNIHARPGDGTNLDIQKRHEILYNRMLSSDRDKWNLTIGVSFKDSEKIARDISRRLLPDAWTMARAVEAKRIEIEDAVNNLARRVTTIKSGTGTSFREHHHNKDTSAYRWEGRVNDDNYQEIFHLTVTNDCCSLTINHLTPEQVVAIMRKVQGNEI